ncbi:protein translocase subunit secF [Pedococcus cremeus]|uniref:Protein-export membrane protein SecF n=1 Tax=Pedococcus cremeus TaxID=587636 RepID=A0A1H9TUH0_9MICO|nr:protein translocase subunit SecF [Pedococcus cremeus]SES00766.1 protein translocase subunit secF [Pedococcus cremeus]
MINFSQFGNDLYTGRRSIPFIAHRRRWYAASAVLVLIALLGLGVKHLNLGLEFTGGSEFRVAAATNVDNYESRARDAVQQVSPGQAANITKLGTSSSTIRVQTEQLTDAQNNDLRAALAKEFGVGTNEVSASFVGPSWGQSVTQQALRALVVFLVLTFLVMAIYFRTWKMSLAAMIALLHDMVITVGVYALTGLEVSPATMIGFLTVLGYSLYDTVVVFDKVRENTQEAFGNKRRTYAEAANLAVNQTVVRSINTTVVALLPIAAVLVMGFTVLGPGTLLDLSLVLFIGMAIGAYSSIFIATPALVSLRHNEPAVQELEKAAAKFHTRQAKKDAEAQAKGTGPGAGAEEPATSEGLEPAVAGRGTGSTGSTGSASPASTASTPRTIHPYAQTGPRNQPRRKPKSQR